MPEFNSKRLGVHYFADTDHFHRADIEKWLSGLTGLGVKWTVLQAPLDRAIPEEFISYLVKAGIEPVLHFPLSLEQPTPGSALATLFKSYASWGVKYVVLYDRPNLRSQWPGAGWTQRGLVERFLAMFTPLAHAAQLAGLTPVFPPLEPGGDYWDTAFLRASLEALVEDGEAELVEQLVLGAYVWTEDRGLDWGAGGPEAWPATLPYHTPKGSEDQRGFRIFDWYNAVSRAAVGFEMPILIVAAGVQRDDNDVKRDAQPSIRYINMAKVLQKTPGENPGTIPDNLLACNFWLLASNPGPDDKVHAAAWFRANGKLTELGERWMEWHNSFTADKSVAVETGGEAAAEGNRPSSILFETPMPIDLNGAHSIRHYLLLPNAADWPLHSIQTFVSQHQPTIGYSAEEALRAVRVTLAGGLQSFSDELIRKLIAAGCQVENLPAAS